MYVSAIVLAAGRGLRFKSRIPKPLVKINSKPIIIYSLSVLSSNTSIKDIILVVNSKNSGRIINLIKKYRIKKVSKIVHGGMRRQDSVYNGLEVLDKNTDLVLIHDAARPFINKDMVLAAINEARKSGAAIVGVPVKATIKSIKVEKYKSRKVERTLARNKLWEIQTPQVFRKDLIEKAYKRFRRQDATDDATLVEKLGHKVSVILSSYSNIKITTPEDLVLAEVIVKSQITNSKSQTSPFAKASGDSS